MTLRTMAGGFALGALTALITTQAISGNAGDDLPMPEHDMAAMMAAIQPGPHHDKLKRFVGEWDIAMKVFWGGPGGPAMETTGRSTIRSVLDGRFIAEESSWTMHMPDQETGAMTELPIKGMGLTGYDNHRQTYVGTWADNFNTHLLTMKGGVDPTGMVYTRYGEMDEPGLNVTGRMVKYVTELIDEDTFVMSIYDLHAADDYKVIEATYTRRP